MRSLTVLFLILVLALVSCQSAPPQTLIPATQADESTSTPAPVPATATSTSTAAVTATVTAVPAGTIHVDTLEQEIYPFVENGKCSLGEAIFAANAGEPKDSCAAGAADQSVIELMPGEYHFTQRDQTPPQVEWAFSLSTVGNALPSVLLPLTVNGNGAVLIRDEAADPFRFFEVLFGALTLNDLTLQGGDVGEDEWGGAIYASNVTVVLDHVRFVGNHADNGGGLYFTFGKLTVTNSEFVENRAGFAGGGLYLDSAKAEIISTQFIVNHVGGQGGGLRAESVTLTVEDSLFMQNKTDSTRGGGMYLYHVNAVITRSEFYQNQSSWVGGAISIYNPTIQGTDTEEGDPLDGLDQSSTVTDLMTSIPGFEETLQAHPSGVFVDFHEDGQIHDSCFANNITTDPNDPNWAAALVGMSQADSNYWGDPSGPAGWGPGKGDQIGKKITFEPFLDVRPEYCDLDLSDQQ